ncbi:NAD+ synthase [Congregibacter litoralis]|uniref:Glutamine-dependent NAD(+) synthetase n=1 Tax=Congregibacter litoralis KT71 TaxID=314285 RepID=A4ADU5_9GAMM|nr:NAD+ synthase [Congregibacter litoralis]EAQ95827.1 NAD+ synthetase [Congregibacter litoralis KT71]
MHILMAQINTQVGDFTGNADQVIEVATQACEEQDSPVVVFPELTLSGYPPEDLLLRPALCKRVNDAIIRLHRELPPQAWVIVGYPIRREGLLYNCAGVFHDGELKAEYRKNELPNYQVFDEKRYFTAGSEPCVLEIQGTRVGLSICEDIWVSGPSAAAATAGAELLINLNASPFHRGKQQERLDLLARRCRDNNLAAVYVNQVGGQDELVFDGGSFAMNSDGKLVAQSPRFETASNWCEWTDSGSASGFREGVLSEALDDMAAVWQALVLGMRDYVNKNGFPSVVLGLSGGVDSALTLAVAVDALGASRVEAVMMPFRYTSDISIADAAEQSATLGVRHSVISIEPIYESFLAALKDEFAGLDADTTEENLQARCRGVLLMSISNKKRSLVLTTGNKSELAVGYSTLYGDMAGGFDVLKDVPKTLVYALCRYRNSLSPCIPERVIERPPSAELAPDQKDEDSLPPYDVLDRILELYVEQDFSAEAIIAEGIPREDVERAVRLVDLNEYKRRQAPIGVRITQRGFGRDRRYPITSAWRMGE